MGKEFDWKEFLYDTAKDLFGVLAVSLSLLLMDGRLYLFLICLLMCLGICLGLGVYRYKKRTVIQRENKRLGNVARFGLVLCQSQKYEDALKRFEEEGYGKDKLFNALIKGDDLSSYGKSGGLLMAMSEAYKNGKKEEIDSFIEEALHGQRGGTVLMSRVSGERSLGVAMACIASIPLALLPYITVVQEAIKASDWLLLFLRLVLLFLFIAVEFMGSNFSQKKGSE